MPKKVESDLPSVGRRIRALMDLADFTAESLAAALGVPEHWVDNRCQEKASVSDEDLRKIADALGGNLEWLKTCRGDPLNPKVPAVASAEDHGELRISSVMEAYEKARETNKEPIIDVARLNISAELLSTWDREDRRLLLDAFMCAAIGRRPTPEYPDGTLAARRAASGGE